MITAIGTAMIPLVLAALGGLIAEKAGVLNIALEGAITAGAFTVAAMMILGSGPGLGALAAMFVGSTLGLVLALTTLGLGSNLFIAGLGMNLLVPALTGLASQSLWGHKGNLRLPMGTIGGPMILTIPLFAWLLIPLVASFWMFLRHGEGGRRIRAAGEQPAILSERGLRPRVIQGFALVFSSSVASLAGALLALRVGAWVPGMSAGRGWIALVAIWLGFRNPWGILAAAGLFAMAEVGSGRLQGFLPLPASTLLALPYLVALVALTLTTVLKGRRKGF